MASLSTSELKKSIAGILKGADLNSLSSKKVRKKLEEQYEADFTERKEEIDKIVMNMITAEENDKSDSEDENNSDPESSPASSESEEEKAPPPKKSKPAAKLVSKKKAKNDVDVRSNSASEKSDEDDSDVDDEALARKLQEEERNSRRRAVKKITSKKESNKKANKNSDGKPRVRKESTYTKKCLLSADLAGVVGADEMARHDVVKKMWAVVRERDLFDPKNKQFAICDEQLQKVFGAKRVRMFGMMKYLKNHIKDQK